MTLPSFPRGNKSFAPGKFSAHENLHHRPAGESNMDSHRFDLGKIPAIQSYQSSRKKISRRNNPGAFDFNQDTIRSVIMCDGTITICAWHRPNVRLEPRTPEFYRLASELPQIIVADSTTHGICTECLKKQKEQLRQLYESNTNRYPVSGNVVCLDK